MGKQYYCLVSGLKEYAFGADNKDLDALAVKEEILGELHGRDQNAARLLYTWYDIQNIIASRAGREGFNPLGNIPREEFDEGADRLFDQLPPQVSRVLGAFTFTEDTDYDDVSRIKTFENMLTESYFEACAASKNGFLEKWSAFERDLRNFMAAILARRADKQFYDIVVGEGEVAESLLKSNAPDFGLKGITGFVEQLTSILEQESNIVERERKIDTLRLQKAEELAQGHYFDIDALLGYIVRINILDRHAALEVNKGRAVFEGITKNMHIKD